MLRRRDWRLATQYDYVSVPSQRATIGFVHIVFLVENKKEAKRKGRDALPAKGECFAPLTSQEWRGNGLFSYRLGCKVAKIGEQQYVSRRHYL